MVAAFVARKAFEIAYACCRIAGNSGNQQFAAYMQGYGLMLLDAATRMDKGNVSLTIELIRQFAAFGAGAGFMNQADADILTRQSEVLHTAIIESGKSGKNGLQDSGLQDMFSEDSFLSEKGPEKNHEIQERNAARNRNSQSRHASILGKIKKDGNCRLKDLQDYLPDVSDRTLRYDLQELVANGEIERFGGGPSVYYKIHEEIIPMPPSHGGPLMAV